jgi:hypothetical protein
MSGPIVLTMDTDRAFAARLALDAVTELHPAVVDQWLINLKTSCEHGHQHQMLATVTTTADVPGAAPVAGPLRAYSHQFSLVELGVRAAPGHDMARSLLWIAADVATNHIGGYTWIEHPIAVADDEQARGICHWLVRDVLCGVLAAMPETDHQMQTWQLVIATKVWGATTGPDTRRDNGARIDPHKAAGRGTILPDDGLGFAINPRRRAPRDDRQEEAR